MVGMKNFWKKLPRPFFALAPMADVTDRAFREMFVRYGRPGGPDVFWTEFVSADGLAHPDAREKLLRDLAYSERERPIVAQIFGANPENIRAAAALCRELGFDGVDINMGCPDRSVERQGAGAALIKNPGAAREIIAAAKEGAEDIPVSVKTRVGYNKNEIREWVPALLEAGIAALTIHARTRKEMSKVPAHWEDVRIAANLRGEIAPETIIIGNGDVASVEDGRRRAAQYGCDGVMVGRAVFGNPWFFRRGGDARGIPPEEKLRALAEHTRLFEKEFGKEKNFAIMKKHFKAYVSGFDGAKELRMKLMEANDAAEVERTIDAFLRNTVRP